MCCRYLNCKSSQSKTAFGSQFCKFRFLRFLFASKHLLNKYPSVPGIKERLLEKTFKNLDPFFGNPDKFVFLPQSTKFSKLPLIFRQTKVKCDKFSLFPLSAFATWIFPNSYNSCNWGICKTLIRQLFISHCLSFVWRLSFSYGSFYQEFSLPFGPASCSITPYNPPGRLHITH